MRSIEAPTAQLEQHSAFYPVDDKVTPGCGFRISNGEAPRTSL